MTNSLKPHKQLDVWKASIDLVVEVYRVTGTFPETEKYNLVSQMRRAAVSIPANIAEGAARNTKKEFINYLPIAKGSLSELATCCEIGKRPGCVLDPQLIPLETPMQRIDSMLSGLIRFERTSHVSRFTSHEGRKPT